MSRHRRDFLRSSLAASTLVSMGSATIPAFLERSALGAAANGSRDRVLVVVQLVGGNDGLNTIVPFGHDGYLRGRRRLRISPNSIHKISHDIGLHPSMGQMARLVEAGHVAVVQGVGYPNPDRSHFRSMEIWESARVDPTALESGWLGRAIDSVAKVAGAGAPALHVGTRSTPLALRSRQAEVPSLESLEHYRLRAGGDAESRQAVRASLEEAARSPSPADDPLLGFLRRSTLTAYESSRRLEQVAQVAAGGLKYPAFGLATRLELIAQIIKADFGTRIFYTSLDGFDTHANQLGPHAALLSELSDSIAAFHKDLSNSGIGDRVAVLTFSEFGRRVAENASQGTDHGAAAPVFVIGPVAQAGLVRPHPSLDDLEDGDLKHHTDFRAVYAAVLEHWLEIPSAEILGADVAPLPLFKAT